MDLFYHKRYSSHFEFSETKEAVISTLIYEDCAIKKITYSYIRAKKQLSDIEIFFSKEKSVMSRIRFGLYQTIRNICIE